MYREAMRVECKRALEWQPIRHILNELRTLAQHKKALYTRFEGCVARKTNLLCFAAAHFMATENFERRSLMTPSRRRMIPFESIRHP